MDYKKRVPLFSQVSVYQHGTSPKSIRRKCRVCGEMFSISVEDQKKLEFMGFNLPVRCKKCNSLKKQGESLICEGCGSTFIFSELRKQQLQQKYGEKYRQPKYCSICRKKWREERNEM